MIKTIAWSWFLVDSLLLSLPLCICTYLPFYLSISLSSTVISTFPTLTTASLHCFVFHISVSHPPFQSFHPISHLSGGVLRWEPLACLWFASVNSAALYWRHPDAPHLYVPRYALLSSPLSVYMRLSLLLLGPFITLLHALHLPLSYKAPRIRS